MDLIPAFKPVLVVTIEELTPKIKITNDVVQRCLKALEEKYQILLDLSHNTIYISGERE